MYRFVYLPEILLSFLITALINDLGLALLSTDSIMRLAAIPSWLKEYFSIREQWKGRN
jgi:hypothetical protein